MASRQRNSSKSTPTNSSPSSLKRSDRAKRRARLFETLEARHLLAGPQLIGIQPNEGELIIDGSIRQTAPRILTFRFDEDQTIAFDANTINQSIQIVRAGSDGAFNTTDDITIAPALVTLGENAPNEVVVRFSEALPDDRYQIRINAYDDPVNRITALRNTSNEVFVPKGNDARIQTIGFDLQLGAIVQSVVPQPVIRNSDGTLSQNRNEIVVYFNEDPLFVEDQHIVDITSVAGGRLQIEAVFPTGAIDPINVQFAIAPTGTPVSAEYDVDSDRLLISSRSTTTVTEILNVVNAIPRFRATSTLPASAVFNAGTGVVGVIRPRPTSRSAENPRFYQLLLTQDTVRTTDDALYYPEEVIYDQATHTARLFFASDLNELGADADGNAGVGLAGGTFRLRIGTAVDDRIDIIVEPQRVDAVPQVTTDFGVTGLAVQFISKVAGEPNNPLSVLFENTGSGGLTVRADVSRRIIFNLGGSSPQIRDLRTVALASPSVNALIDVTWSLNDINGAGGTLSLPSRVVGSNPLVLNAVGDTLESALQVGVFGRDKLTSLVFTESIVGKPSPLVMPGAELLGTPGNGFQIDTIAGVRTVLYNFKQDFQTFQGQPSLNQITESQKERIREALGLYAEKLGVQFRETVDEGITFARGDVARLLPAGGNPVQRFAELDAALRIDSTFQTSTIVFSNAPSFGPNYGEDFTRKAAAGIGLLLGLRETPELPAQTLLSLNPAFLAGTGGAAPLGDLEPVFPSNFDVLQGQALYRPDSNDVDLYRFVVDLNDANKLGTFTAETFAERLPDSSLLDTTLTLFQEQSAFAEFDFGLGKPLNIRFDSKFEGKIGNDTQIRYVRGGSSVSVVAGVDAQGKKIDNVVVVAIPGNGTATINDVVTALNNSPIASSLFRVSVVSGNATQRITSPETLKPVVLAKGGLVQLVRNDDYFSEDSRIIATLGEGTYYVGVASTGNDSYDPTMTNSGFGGRTEGKYELHLKYEPQVDEVDTIRDLDGSRVGVPSTPLDGDGDGVPGGIYNFWFQTRALNRRVQFTSSSAGIRAGETITLTDVLGSRRTYQFVNTDAAAQVSISQGNVPVIIPITGLTLSPVAVAQRFINAFNNDQARTTESGVIGATLSGSTIEFNGIRSINLSDNFRGVEVFGRTIFVDKTAGVNADGSLDQPFNNIANANVPNAFGSASSGDIVRIVGNGGGDGNESTESDNLSYQLGTAGSSSGSGAALEDGRQMVVPQGVTTMIDSGAIFKLRNSYIGAGSNNTTTNLSGGAIQVLGTPRRVTLSRQGQPVSTTLITDSQTVAGYRDGSVIFTSMNDRAVGTQSGAGEAPAPGNWGGLLFRRDVDQAQGRVDLEDEGIFLNHVTHADIRYGGSQNILVNSNPELVNPISIINLRPTITQNQIRFSADAAVSASPDSFEETTFQSPKFQNGGEFTADYDRVGPSIYDNLIVDNSINGLLIRVRVTSTEDPRELTSNGRFDDTDIVHFFTQDLVVAGTPGGSIDDEVRPDFSPTSFSISDGGSLAAGTYNYRMTFVDSFGFESAASAPTASQTVTANASIELLNLPEVPDGYVSRRLYRLNSATNQYFFVAQLTSTQTNYIDNGPITTGLLDTSRVGIRGRLDASLVIDPGIVMKLNVARIELGQGTNLIAEGEDRDRIVFTSVRDDRFGAGGTFDTNNDVPTVTGNAAPRRGDWSGIYASPTSRVSFDFVTVAYAGGISQIDAGRTRGFTPLELQQADARIVNSRFEFNDSGQDGAGPVDRNGRLSVTPSTIFVRGSQPIIVANEFVDNRGSVIDIDVESMSAERLVDTGRETSYVGAFTRLNENFGPLIRLNRFETFANSQQLSGLEIRGGTLTTETIFDDTDIDHVLFDGLVAGNQNVSGGLRLLSRSGQSLVVKLSGSGSPYEENVGTGFTANGVLTNDPNRLGGTVHIVGLPGAPVILTSLFDDTVGSGLRTDGSQMNDTNGDGARSYPEPNDWRSILLDRYSHDRNVDFILERTISTEIAPGLNGTPANAQVLGSLANNEFGGDEVRRLGFEVQGYLSADHDVDVYSFKGEAGTRVWFDINNTVDNLDTVVELLDENGNVLVRSDNSAAEVAGTPLEAISAIVAGTAGSLASGPQAFIRTTSGGLYDDTGSNNIRDAGFAVTLPGNRGSEGTYFARVRSRGNNPNDLEGGLSQGGYRLQIRIREQLELPGSVVRYADIRYANHGIHVIGKPGESPLLGDAQENESVNFQLANNDRIGFDASAPGRRSQYIGNLQTTKTGSISVGGSLVAFDTHDFYRFDVNGSSPTSTTVFDIDYADGFSRPNTSLAVFYDPDDDGPIQPELVLFGQDSNVLEDQALVGSNDPLELLRRGSIATGDSYVGPVALPQGVYYVGVFRDGNIPQALNDPAVRREPIDSILRIFDDRIESNENTTFAPPVHPNFVDTTTSDPEWTISTARSGNSGRPTTSTFTGSRVGTDITSGVLFEPNVVQTSLLQAVAIENLTPGFSYAQDINIGSQTVNTSTYLPHATIRGTTVGEIVDIFSFEVPVNPDAVDGLVILDIDNGFNPFVTAPGTVPGAGQPTLVDPSSVDLKLELFDISGNPIAISRTASASFGDQGSIANDFSTLSNDPYIELRLAPGTYYVAVSPEQTVYSQAGGANTAPFSFDLAVGSRPVSGTYDLNISIENYPTIDVQSNNQSYRYDRTANTNTATLSSTPFDLTGYSASDAPRFYFTYYYDPSIGDTVSVTARSAQQTTPLPIGDVTITAAPFRNVWVQEIGSLNAFAGHDDVVIEFTYQTTGGASLNEGLYIDDFVVGFAERGELITNALAGNSRIVGTNIGTASGEYQLEIRTATPYSEDVGDLTATFDTNHRFSRSANIIAPLPSQLVDGDKFRISDQIQSLVFEFDLTGNGVASGNVPIPVSGATTQGQVAQAIIAAFNSQLVGSSLRLKASDTSGSVAGGNRGAQVSITGIIVGDVIELGPNDVLGTNRSDVTNTAGEFRLPVVYVDDFGDSNIVRSQSQIIIDSNKISDVRGIGIWSEFGRRLTDPQDARGDDPLVQTTNSVFVPFEFDFDLDQDFLELPPMGNVNPGAVRNLPILNDSRIGGLAPGPVIVNNTIDQAGFAGIKVDGANRPIVIDGSMPTGSDLADGFGDEISDGLVMIVDSGNTRVVFEFEDISGAPGAAGGNTVGGNGYEDGHVPIYYRRTTPSPYNPGPPSPFRVTASTRHEVMMSIHQSILGSILVTNGLVKLVNSTLGPSPFVGSASLEATYQSEISFPSAALFLEGVSGVYWDNSFQRAVQGIDNNPLDGDFDTSGGPLRAARAPIHEANQPTSRIVNNTIYGSDGTRSSRSGLASAEPNDVIEDAVELNVGKSHGGAYRTTGRIGDGPTALPQAADVDFFQVNLTVGDRLIVDIDTNPANSFDTTLRLFDASGNEVFVDLNTALASHLDATGNDVLGVDPSIDFQVQATGTYYIAVSSDGNAAYDPFSLNNRVAGTGGIGTYDLSVEVLAPRSLVLSLDNGETTSAAGLIGATFTLTQVGDLPNGTNEVVFQFTGGGGVGPGMVAVPIPDGSPRVPDIMRSIANAIDRAGMSALNRPVFASALGGQDGVTDFAGGERGLLVYSSGVAGGADFIAANGVSARPLHFYVPVAADLQNGFGHNRTGQAGSAVGNGTTELYVLIQRAAKIELSQQAINFGLGVDPRPDSNADQLLPNTGLLLTGGSSATVINNVFANLHESLVVEESRVDGFSGSSPVRDLKPADVVVTANVFQDDQTLNSLFRQRMNTAFGNTGLTTDSAAAPSNVNGGADDRNIIVASGTPLLQNPEGNNFLPAETSILIDNSISAVPERAATTELRASLGLSISNILAPDLDVNGVIRADNPNFSPGVGGGDRPFLDRGSNELADFVGPVATLLDPLDNDAQNVDVDPQSGFLRLNSGIYKEFRIQLRDTGDSSDPFSGLGVDDSSIVVAPIPGLRQPGANFTLFENERLLTEGVDYSFDYDQTQKVVTLRSLAGVFQNDRAYRIELNNKDNTVFVARSAADINDGDQVTITTASGANLVFEFETGIAIRIPDPITLIVPTVGVGAGGINDNDLFSLTDAEGNSVTFEFDTNTGTLENTERIALPSGSIPAGGPELVAYREAIATAITAAIARRLESNTDASIPAANKVLDLDVKRLGDRIIIGGENGSFADTESGGLQQLKSTLALQVPSIGLANRDGDLFIINDGTTSVTFEIDNNNVLTSQNNIRIPVANQTNIQTANAIFLAILNSPLAINPIPIGQSTIYLNLPSDGSVNVLSGPLQVLGVTRLPNDEDLLTFDPKDPNPLVQIELNRTDLPLIEGRPDPKASAVSNPTHRRVDFIRSDTAEAIALKIRDAIALDPIPGISTSNVQVFNGNLLSIGGEEGLSVSARGPIGIDNTATSTPIRVIGEAGVTESSSVSVAGPILLSVPFLGGRGVEDGDLLILDNQAGTEVVFEFIDITSGTRNISITGAIPINFTRDTASPALALAISNAIAGAGIGITPTIDANNRVSLGVIPIDSVNLTGVPRSGTPFPTLTAQPIPTREASGFEKSQGLVNDGEVLEIRQGTTVVRYEFEESQGGGGVQVGNVPIIFDPEGTIDILHRQIATTISNNLRGLQLTPQVNPETGAVTLNNLAGTTVDISAAPSLRLTGVPGGAATVPITPAFSAVETKQALIAAINGVTQRAGSTFQNVLAADRGGSTFFVSGGQLTSGPLTTFNLPAISDVAGNPLKPNRGLTSQFTLLLPTIGLDYGDAPDPRGGVPGRYPTLLANNGPRHIVDRVDDPNRLVLGTTIDIDPDGFPSTGANGDDLDITVSSNSELFGVRIVNGVVQIEIKSDVVDPFTADGDTITISSGTETATLEFDIDGRFDEDNFAIAPGNPTAVASIRLAIQAAIAESPLFPASVSVDPTNAAILLVSANDEDGVNFLSDVNPQGYLNSGIPLMIEVTVTGSGILQGWIDFNADGDFDDPNEAIIPQPTGPTFDARRAALCPNGELGINSPIFAGTEPQTRSFCVIVPPNASLPETLTQTYARFRVSREGNLSPTGLALSGEVEDYALTIQPGSPPTIPAAVANRTFRVNEDSPLQVLDRTGSLTSVTTDNGLLVGVIEPDGQGVAVFGEDIGTQLLRTPSGTIAGELEVFRDGTFTFTPEPQFFGTTSFSVRVTDVNPTLAANAMVAPTRVTASITVDPVNDRPEATSTAPIVTSVTIDEDAVRTFEASALIDPFFSPGPANESQQVLVFQSVSGLGVNQSTLGGSLAISPDGRGVVYTPPADLNNVTDTFTYVVADVPEDGQTSAQATRRGTVSITLRQINDAPRTGTDTFRTLEGRSVTIAIQNGTDGILDNDFAGPANELNPNAQNRVQGVSLIRTGYPLTTFRGGTVRLNGNQLTYEPPAFFNGVDTFNYSVEDVLLDSNGNIVPGTSELGLVSTGTVNIIVGGVNDPPEFLRVDGSGQPTPITRNEVKSPGQTQTFDLNQFFRDREGDPLSFSVQSADPSLVSVNVASNLMTLTFQPFRSGQANLTIRATDQPSNGSAPLSTTVQVPVIIIDTPDAPELIRTLNPLSGQEDQVVTADLTRIFLDRDGILADSAFTITGFDSISGTPGNIAEAIRNSDLVQSISIVNSELRIVLKPNRFGSVNIDLTASDGTSQVTDSFTLEVTPVPDAPQLNGVPIPYNVAIGSELQVVNRSLGLLQNIVDPDGDTMTIAPNSVGTFSLPLGTLTILADGTFSYFNEPSKNPTVGQTDSFNYTVLDSTGRSSTFEAQFRITQSEYQNPIGSLSADVSGDGSVDPIDSLLVINFLRRRGQSAVDVDDIGPPPPNYYDVDGDGQVTPLDALSVMNTLRRRRSSGESISAASPVNLAGTKLLASADSTGITTGHLAPAVDVAPATITSTTDRLFAAGIEIENNAVASMKIEIPTNSSESVSSMTSVVDEVFAQTWGNLS